MLERDAYGRLLEWKLANRGKALLVNGARQVGKTFLVEEFARREYSHLVKVDFLQSVTMYPLTFLEFCRARNVPEAVFDRLRECYEHMQPVSDAIHGPLVDLFRRYLVVGGMPEVVQAYVALAADMGEVRTKQEDLVSL